MSVCGISEPISNSFHPPLLISFKGENMTHKINIPNIKPSTNENYNPELDEIDWATFFGLNDNASDEEIEQAFEDQMC